MNEGKLKNEEVIERRWDRLIAAFAGFAVSLPVAVWVTMHLFYAQYRFEPGGLLPAVMSGLDCLMTVAVIAGIAGLAYFAGQQNLHKHLPEIINELEKPG